MKTFDVLQSVIAELKVAAAMPRFIDLANVGSRFWCSSYDVKPTSVISEDVYTGFSRDRETAVLKSLIEMVERRAAIEGAAAGNPTCRVSRSDGFAAFPRTQDSRSQARENALSEAIERFAWATWWDLEETAFELRAFEDLTLSQAELEVVSAMRKSAGIGRIHIVAPRLRGSLARSVFILLAESSDGGFISGGACGIPDRDTETVLRALDELYRHGLALRRLNENRQRPVSFYERRLVYFGLGHGNDRVLRRLERSGSIEIEIPDLEIDDPIPHRLATVADVHRCLFRNQPPFVGGDLERLCL